MTRFRLAASLTLLFTASAAAQPAPPPRVEPQVARLLETAAKRAPASTAATGRMVVTAADPRAAAAGMAMLRAGGTATDAALATAIALAVVEPQSSGIGGGAFFVGVDERGRVSALDGRETGPAAVRADRFVGPDGKAMPFREAVESGRSVGVPGLVALAAEAHRRGGKVAWARLFAPAIALARDGWVLTPRFARTLTLRRALLATGGGRAIFFDPAGEPLTAGTRVRNPALAATLERIARLGRDGFYRGPVAAAVARAVGTDPRGGAPMTAADLSGYRVAERTPLCGRYRGWRLCGMPPESSGTVAVLGILGMLEAHDLRALGPTSPVAWHLFADAMRLALADREAYLGDPAFAPVPTAGLVDPTYLRARGALLRTEVALADVRAGTPPGLDPAMAPGRGGVEKGTSSLAAVDAAGRMVVMTSTIESIFGSGVFAGGFPLNNELTDFDLVPTRDGRPVPNAPAAGKRPRSSMAPMLLWRPDGTLFGAVGAAGGTTIIAQVAKAVIAMVDWGMTPEDAVAAPALFAAGARFSFERGTAMDAMAPVWEAMGHKPVGGDLPLKANVIARVPGGWRGAGDPRTEGQAVAR